MEQNTVDTPIFAYYLLQLLVKNTHSAVVVSAASYLAMAIALVVAIMYS